MTKDEALDIIKQIERKGKTGYQSPEDKFLSPDEIQDKITKQQLRNQNNEKNEPANFIPGLTEENIQWQLNEIENGD